MGRRLDITTRVKRFGQLAVGRDGRDGRDGRVGCGLGIDEGIDNLPATGRDETGETEGDEGPEPRETAKPWPPSPGCCQDSPVARLAGDDFVPVAADWIPPS